MKISIPMVDLTVECTKNTFCSIIIENPKVMYDILCDIKGQLDGEDGKIVLSEENKILPISKFVELLTQFVPFELNKKALINKAILHFQQVALDEQHYPETMEFLATLEAYLWNLSVELIGNLKFTKISLDSIVKAVGIEFQDEDGTLPEKILDYMELVREYDKEKLFITLNLRSFISDSEMHNLINDIMKRHYQIIMIENLEHSMLEGEKRYIIDESLSIIC